MLLCRVALGQVKDYTKVTYGLTEPPSGYHSVHGVRSTPSNPTEFVDDEYVIFDPTQQQQEYLVEFHFKDDTISIPEFTQTTITTTSASASSFITTTTPLSTRESSNILLSSKKTDNERSNEDSKKQGIFSMLLYRISNCNLCYFLRFIFVV
jgi:hypothetical protein